MTSLLSVQDLRVAKLTAACHGDHTPGGLRYILRWYDLETGEEMAAESPEPGKIFVSASLRWTSEELCPLTYRHAKKLASTFGVRLPTREEARSFSKLPHVSMQTLAWNDPDFATVEGTRRVTARVDSAREARGLGSRMQARSLGCKLVDNEGKYWIDGASPGWALLVGFFDVSGMPLNTGTGAPGKPGYGPKGEPHNDLHVDYSMAPRFVWEG